MVWAYIHWPCNKCFVNIACICDLNYFTTYIVYNLPDLVVINNWHVFRKSIEYLLHTVKCKIPSIFDMQLIECIILFLKFYE